MHYLQQYPHNIIYSIIFPIKQSLDIGISGVSYMAVDVYVHVAYVHMRHSKHFW